MQDERGNRAAPRPLARRITTLKVFFGWLHGIGVIGTDPADARQQPVRTPLPKVLNDDEVSRLACGPGLPMGSQQRDARPYLLVSLLMQTGIKKAERARLLIEDVDVTQPQSLGYTCAMPKSRTHTRTARCRSTRRLRRR
ncbi:MAG: hypothetical protein R2854_15970 [Caldilineaceae bacterium]